MKLSFFADSQGDITIWDLTEWAQRKKIYEKGNEIETLDFSHDGKIFATAGKVMWHVQIKYIMLAYSL